MELDSNVLIEEKSTSAYCIVTDGGRSKSTHQNQRNDCTVIALAVFLDVEYDIAYNALKELGRKNNSGFWFPLGLPNVKEGRILGYDFKWKNFPAIRNQPRENVINFAKNNRMDKFILRIAKHVLVVKSGIIYESAIIPSYYKCVYGIWH